MGRAESADIGITFASAGIAETATIMQRCTEKVWTGSMPSAYRPHCPVAQRAPSSLI